MQRGAVEELLVVGDVLGLESIEVFGGNCCGGGDVERGFAGAIKDEFLTDGAERAANMADAGLSTKPGAGLGFSGLPLAVWQGLAFEYQQVVAGGRGGVGFAAEAGAKGELAGLIGPDAQGDQLGRVTGEDFAGEVCVLRAVAGGVDGGGEVEFALVTGDLIVAGEVEMEVAEGLIGRHAARLRDDVPFGKCFGFADLAGPKQTAHFGKGAGSVGVEAIDLAAGPDAVVIQLQPFVGSAAEDHGAQAAIADGKRFGPFAGGAVEVNSGLGRNGDGEQKQGGSHGW